MRRRQPTTQPRARRRPRPLPTVWLLSAMLLPAAGCTQFGPMRSRPAPANDTPEVVSGPQDQPGQDAPYARALKWAEQVPRLDDVYHQVEQAEREPLFETAADAGRDPNAAADEPSGSATAGGAKNAAAASQPAGEPPAVAPAASQPASPPQPPKLERVSVAPAPSDAPPPARPAAASPAGVNEPMQTARSPISLRELLRDWLNTPADDSFRAQLDRRILLVLAGDYEAARQPPDDATPEQQALVRELIEMLITIREARGSDPAREAEHVLDTLEKLREALVPAADLKITRLEVCRAVRGFGQFERIDPPVFPAGRTSELIAYIESENFASRRDDDQFVSRFSLRTELLDADGQAVVRLVDDGIEDRCASRRRDCFIPRLVKLPATLRPGRYVLKVSLTDRIGHKVAEEATTIRIESR